VDEKRAPLFGQGDDAETIRPVDVSAGSVVSIILGNRSTHARYHLRRQEDAEKLLQTLALTPQSARAAAAVDSMVDSQQLRAAADQGARLVNALDRSQLQSIQARLARCWTPAFCLDYDGTLSPIVSDPATARLLPGVRSLLQRLSERHPVAIVSGRSLEKLLAWVRVQGLYFAASHGFEIMGPHGSALNYTVAQELLPTIQDALRDLQVGLRSVPGVQLEDNKFALSVHTRNVSHEDLPRLDAMLNAALEEQPLLRRSEGKCVIELRPQVHWHKGRAVEWMLKNMCEQMGLPTGVAERNATVMPIYIGDDTTDEDAFRELRDGRGLPIIVRETAPLRNETAAEMWLRDPQEVADFLSLFLTKRQLVQEEELLDEVAQLA